MIENKYYETLEGLKAFTNLVECEICPFNMMCAGEEGALCDIMIDEIYEIEEKINMEG